MKVPIEHRHIVPIYNFGIDESIPWMAMRLVPGGTLKSLLKQGRLDHARVIAILKELAHALDYAHAQGVLHRDVKPPNILLDHQGQVYLADFGIARMVESSTIMTAGGVVTGTPQYMSPEQWRGENIDRRTDIYALGVVAYEMLTGSVPFSADTPAAMMTKHLLDPIPIPPASDVPEALLRPLLKCLDKNPDAHWPSATAFVTALEQGASAADSLVVEPTRDALATATLSSSKGPVWGGRLLGRPGTFGAVLLVGLGLGLWYSRGGTNSGPGADASPSVAVLPFENLAGASDADEYLGDGVAEAVTTDLARVPGLTVINRGSAFRYRGRDADVKKAAGELNVRYLVQGSLQRSGERLRLHARLVDAATGHELWAERYDRELTDVFAVQDNIARSVVQAIGPRLVPRASTATRRPPPDFQAYDAYLRGRAAWNRRTQESIAQAVALFERAIALEPGYAEAYAGLSDAFLTQGRFRYVRYSEALPRASGAAERALALDPDLAEGHASRGALHLERLEWENAEQEYRRAIELQPSYATAHHWYALLLYQLRRLDEGVREATRAAELDPLAVSTHGTVALGLYLRGELDLAFVRGQRAAGLSPDYPGPLRQLSLIAAARGRLPEAFEFARRAAEKGVSSPVPRANLARVHAQLGQRAQARAILGELEREPEPCVGCVVDVHLALGDLDGALAWVERGGWTTAGGSYFPKVDPAYDGFRKDPRFAKLLRLLRLQ
jgi:serine/threonine-protein kinase